jgi:protein-tyrosine phosphatase
MASAMRTPGERIDLPTVPNMRDIGGYPTVDGGDVRTGQLYRSVALNHLAGIDNERFAELRIQTVFDMWTAAESARFTGRAAGFAAHRDK